MYCKLSATTAWLVRNGCSWENVKSALKSVINKASTHPVLSATMRAWRGLFRVENTLLQMAGLRLPLSPRRIFWSHIAVACRLPDWIICRGRTSVGVRKGRQTARLADQSSGWRSPGRRLFVRCARMAQGYSVWSMTDSQAFAHMPLYAWPITNLRTEVPCDAIVSSLCRRSFSNQ